jgi:hypothetical protein
MIHDRFEVFPVHRRPGEDILFLADRRGITTRKQFGTQN